VNHFSRVGMSKCGLEGEVLPESKSKLDVLSIL
jgi:hypothetical protein